ncbi:MAG: hypothetical protein U0228_32765 [Myxococcaceae bacterium]
MILSFVETMRGTLTSPRGDEHPVDFQLKTHGSGRPGAFSVEGVVHAGPWQPEGPCEGTLTISLFPASIAYVVRFTGVHGEALSLEGHKSPSLLAPLKGMTVLPIALLKDGQALATGTMRFDLLELPQFLASWLPVPTEPRRRFEARHRAVSRKALLGGTS